MVPQNGIDEKSFAVSSLIVHGKWLWLSKQILNGDNEPAIVKLLSEALLDLRIEGAASAPVLMEEHSPQYDPQANGSAEGGVKLLKGYFRTLRSNLESEI